MADTTERMLPIVTSVDGQRACIQLDRLPRDTALSAVEIVESLEACHVEITPDVRARVAALCTAVASEPAPHGEFELAVGEPATEPVDASFELLPAAREASPDPNADRIDPFSQQHVFTVHEGTAIGTITRATPGRHGRDVFGKAVRPLRKPAEVTLGPNVRVADDGVTVVAAKTGMVAFDRARKQVDIIELVQVVGNVDHHSGNVIVDTDVLVTGDVLDLFSVRSPKSVTVRGSIEAATVEAGGDVSVGGAIVAKLRGRIRARGTVIARVCHEARVEAVKGIKIEREAMNSRLSTEGTLDMSGGVLIGGVAYARCGIRVKQLGGDSGVATRVIFGMHPQVLAKVRREERIIAVRSAGADKIRAAARPLTEHLRRLSPSQRNRIVELMRAARAIDEEVAEIQARCKGMIADASPPEPATLIVAKHIYPGVTLIVEDRVVTIRHEIRDPVRISRRQVERDVDVIAVNTLTGSITVLPSSEYAEDSL